MTWIVWPLAVLIVMVSPSTETTVPLTVRPAPPPPNAAAAPPTEAGLAAGARREAAAREGAAEAAAARAGRGRCRGRGPADRERDAADGDRERDAEDDVERRGRRPDDFFLAGTTGGGAAVTGAGRDRRRSGRTTRPWARVRPGCTAAGTMGRFGSRLTWDSLSMGAPWSFVAQGADGIETGGLARRPDAEDDADREAEQDGRDDR